MRFLLFLGFTVLVLGCIQDLGMDPLVECKKIENSENQSTCLSNAAIKKQDYKICEPIPVRSIKNNCYRTVALNTTSTKICDEISGPRDKDNCVKDIAVATRSLTTCLLIDNEVLKRKCRDQV